MKILIQNAYSSKNSGDGLLVELTIELLKEAFGDIDYIICANDPESFNYKNVIQSKSATRKRTLKIIYSMRNLLKLTKYIVNGKIYISEYEQALDGVDLIVSVGGGYMRGKSFKETIKVGLNNSIQLFWSTKKNVKVVYLPQSVGPFCNKSFEKMISKSIDKTCLYYMRDDRSYNAFKNNKSVRRAPDLAVLKISQMLGSGLKIENDLKKVYFVVRDINQKEHVKIKYLEKINYLISYFGNKAEVVIQSEGRGNDDREFANTKLNLKYTPRSLKEALDDEKGVVVSVRLHGALESLLNSCPALHLSYERKGFGAYNDLGLGEYVFNSSDFELDTVLLKIKSLLKSTKCFDEKLKSSYTHIENSKELILSDLRSLREG